jgi:lipid-binding SYLF domain-containing protein
MGSLARSERTIKKEGKEETMKKTRSVILVSVIVSLSLALISCQSAPISKSDKEEQQDSVRSMANTTLSQLYAKQPAMKEVIASSAGYAVFSDFGFKVLLMGGARGKGVAVNNATKQETFMEMLELQPGLGLGASKFRVVFTFETQEAFNKFVNSGWEFGANAMAEAKTKTKGGTVSGAVSVAKGVNIYQLDDQGLIVGVSLTGARYYKDKQLN